MSIVKRLNQIFHFNDSISKILRMQKVFVSDIADSIHCEWKKILEKMYGKKINKAMKMGTKIHEEYFSYNVKDPDKAEEKMANGETVEFSSKVNFIDRNRKIIVSGQVDSATFEKDHIVKIVELKTRKELKVYNSDIIQAGTYALCFEKMLKKTLDDLEIQIKVKLRESNQEHLEQYKFGDIRKYVLEKVEKNLDFWANMREPKIADSLSICQICSFFKICDKKKI